MRGRWVLAASATAALLAGCAATGARLAEQGRSDLSAVSICCESIDQLKVIDLPLDKQIVRIDNTRQAFVFDGNKTFFVAYRLPRFERPYSIVLSSQREGSQTNAAIFKPRVAIYDDAWQRTRQFGDDDLRVRGPQLERTVFINPSNQADRYIVIYGGDISSVKEQTVAVMTTTPIVAGPVVFYMHNGHDAQAKLHASPVGQFELETQGLSPRK